jgi:hypothetical protein
VQHKRKCKSHNGVAGDTHYKQQITQNAWGRKRQWPQFYGICQALLESPVLHWQHLGTTSTDYVGRKQLLSYQLTCKAPCSCLCQK